MGVNSKKVLVTKWKFAFITIERETTLTNRIQQNGGKMKKNFGNKFRVSDYNLRKGNHSFNRESPKMRVKWKRTLVIKLELAIIISERETTLSIENPPKWG